MYVFIFDCLFVVPWYDVGVRVFTVYIHAFCL